MPPRIWSRPSLMGAAPRGTWIDCRASFETGALRPPQDEEIFFVPSPVYLILRSLRSRRLEGRRMLLQHAIVPHVLFSVLSGPPWCNPFFFCLSAQRL